MEQAANAANLGRDNAVMTHNRTNNFGPTITTIAFVIWGLMPLYFALLPNADIAELFIFRVTIGLPILFFLVYLFDEKEQLHQLLKTPRELLILMPASLFYAISWSSFMWALTHGHILEASLGFFMTPIFNIILGVLLLKERLKSQHYLAIGLAVAGIIYMSVSYGKIPWLALVMGSFFAVYGLLKKFSRAPDISSVCIETLVQLPITIILFFIVGGLPSFLRGSGHEFMLYAVAALVTMLPIIIFSFGVVRTQLSTVGFLQYIEPSLAFIIGYFILKEPLNIATLTGFCFVWTGLIFTILSSFKFKRSRNAENIPS